MTTWFTSDTHFGHVNVIRLCRRPFKDVTDMNEAMIRAWNAAVQPDDVVWHLGDFSFRSGRSPQDLLSRLNGRKNLIHGNHDGDDTRTASAWCSSQPYAEITVDGQRLVLSHYAFRVWNGVGRGAIHLFGHSHGRLPGNRLSCDVGVDAWNYRPVQLSEITKRIRTLPPLMLEDHHAPVRRLDSLDLDL